MMDKGGKFYLATAGKTKTKYFAVVLYYMGRCCTSADTSVVVSYPFFLNPGIPLLIF